jgi:D-alanyl-D-alanine carboxypeptidase
MQGFFSRHARSIIFWSILSLALFFVGANTLRLEKTLKEETLDIQKASLGASPEPEKKTNPFVGISLLAKAAVVLDVSDGLPGKLVFGFNENTPLPLASLTKLMTAVLALEKGYGLKEKERETMLRLLVSSSNEAARIIEKEISKNLTISFVSAMNEKARDLSLTTMRFSNEAGFDEGEKTAGGYGSAKDTANLLSYDLSLYPSFFEETSRATIKFPSGTIKNTNLLAGKVPGLRAGKTGTTLLSLGNLAVIVDSRKGKRYAIVVLGSSDDGRFVDVATLVDYINLL